MSVESIPRVGMLATLRHRRGLVVSVEPFGPSPQPAGHTATARDGRLHLVRVEYTDADGAPDDTVVWQREHNPTVLEPNALPSIEDDAPMPPAELDALVRATRWSALTPFLAPDDPEERAHEAIAAPFFGAVKIDDFQLVPLLKALQMPRVSLLLADDVGLGKTIEAGLILTELLLRRRIRRVLVISPASLRLQWQQEMRDKFALSFDVIDRHETHQLRKRLGMDANPWRTFPRVIASYHYLRQPDVLEQFMATCRPPADSHGPRAQLPWDLLIVDEAHNLMPANFGEDSDLAKMLRAISPYFEHKLFLTATPHNGHTRCFSGLLEQLDPVRFTQTGEFTADERKRVEQVVVRRLKREINQLDDDAERPRRFADRRLQPVPLFFGKRERQLSRAMASFRAAVKACIKRSASTGDLRAGSFAIEVLNKRLLSCPYTFAESWFRFKHGLEAEESADASEVSAARRASEEEIDDDQEREGRASHAVRTVGAWMHPFVAELADDIAAIDTALADLRLQPEADSDGSRANERPTLTDPHDDERLARLIELVHKQLRQPRGWRDDERLIVFTEYKTTLDYLARRLAAEFDADLDHADSPIRVLYGGMPHRERDAIKRLFNDPDAAVRILIATDAASEGLNLQETARLLLHYEIPWNPSRLEQRNGRLDRHGQARDVFVHHFASNDDADLSFVEYVIRKVHEIREDLGSVGELFDAAFQRRFLDQEDVDRVKASLDRDVARTRADAAVPRADLQTQAAEHTARLAAMARHLDLDPDALSATLDIAMGIGVGRPRLEGPDARGYMRLCKPIPTAWQSLVDDTLRLPSPTRGSLGALPGLLFDPAAFIHDNQGRPVFRPAKDAVLLHLGHPVFRHALAHFARARFPGGHQAFSASRWTVRRGNVPDGADALILLTVEELAINELREPFHHWVRTHRLPVRDERIQPPLPYTEPLHDRSASGDGSRPRTRDEVQKARDLWLFGEAQPDLEAWLTAAAKECARTVRKHLKEAGKQAIKEQKARFRHRLKEVEKAMRETTIARLERERDMLVARLRQTEMYDDMARARQAELRDLNEEIKRRRQHYQELLDTLHKEQTRVLDELLPRRYRLRGDVQVFPVAVEIRLPRDPSAQGGSR